MTAKAIILVLLALSGFSDAIRCYVCTGEDHSCSGTNQVEVECEAADNGCMVSKVFAGPYSVMMKACGLRDEPFDCVQEKLGQTGDCIKGSVHEFERYLAECGLTTITADGQLDLENIIYKVTVNGTELRKGTGIKITEDGPISMCICGTNLCNTDDLGDRDGGNNSSGDK